VILAKVIGRIHTSKRNEKLIGLKLSVVQHVDPNYKEKASFQVVADPLGAGRNEIVVISNINLSKDYNLDHGAPIDAMIVGIVEKIDLK